MSAIVFTPNKYTIHFVMDTTGSMGQFMTALTEALWSIMNSMSMLTSNIEFRIVSYKDYCDGNKLIEYESGDFNRLKRFLDTLRPTGGGDRPEAVRTALWNVIDHVDQEDKEALNTANSLNENDNDSGTTYTPEMFKRQHIVIMMCDAPPHSRLNYMGGYSNFPNETRALTPRKFNWVEICRQFIDRKITYYCFVNVTQFGIVSYYNTLSSLTGGYTYHIQNTYNPSSIVSAVMSVCCHLMGDMENDLPPHIHGFKQPQDLSIDMVNNNDEYQWKNVLPGDLNTQGYHLNNGVPLSSNDEYKQWFPRQFLTDTGSSIDYPSMVDKMKKDQNYMRKIMRIFRELFKPKNITALVTVPVFGKMWRSLCALSRVFPEINDLKDLFSQTITQLMGNDKTLMNAWIEESYNATEEIETLIQEHLDTLNSDDSSTSTRTNNRTGFLVMRRNPNITEDVQTINWKDLLEVTRSCNMTHLRTIAALFQNIGWIEDKPDDNSIHTLPMTMNVMDIFACLSYLVSDQPVILTRRAIILMALIGQHSNNEHLVELAREILTDNLGKWLDWTDESNWAAGFVRFAMSKRNSFTEDELKMLKILSILGWLKFSQCATIEVEYFKDPFGEYPDDKEQCSTCKNWCPISLILLRDGKPFCGTCFYIDARGIEFVNGHSHDKSFLATCRNCNGVYGLNRPENMHCDAYKCHYCRETGSRPPTIECDNCHANHIRPLMTDNTQANTQHPEPWRCRICQRDPDTLRTTRRIPINEFIMQNMDQFASLLGLPPDWISKALRTNQTMWKTFSPQSETLLKHKAPTLNANSTLDPERDNLMYKHHHIEKLKTKFIELINRRQIIMDHCNVCFEQVPSQNLLSMCGNSTCPPVCNECAKSWYGQIKPGQLIPSGHLCCMFCRALPKMKIVRTLQPELRVFLNLMRRGLLNVELIENCAKDHYVLCIGCVKPKFFAAHECARDEMPPVNDFRCDECTPQIDRVEMKNGERPTKNCPNTECNVPIMKWGGCNHLTCTQCGTHFCWHCLKMGDTSDDIYDHLANVHNGIFGDDYNQDEDDYDSDDYDDY